MKKVRWRQRIALLSSFALVDAAAVTTGADPSGGGSNDDWPPYGHDPGGMRYSLLTEINRQNVSRLKIAWVLHRRHLRRHP